MNVESISRQSSVSSMAQKEEIAEFAPAFAHQTSLTNQVGEQVIGEHILPPSNEKNLEGSHVTVLKIVLPQAQPPAAQDVVIPIKSQAQAPAEPMSKLNKIVVSVSGFMLALGILGAVIYDRNKDENAPNYNFTLAYVGLSFTIIGFVTCCCGVGGATIQQVAIKRAGNKN